MRLAGIAIVAVAAAMTGCGDADDPGGTLREGVYEYELTEAYLLENGIAAEQAANESGSHRATLDGGSFVDAWQTAKGATGSCRGTYATEGNRVTFRWTSGCFGDWEMSYRVDGDTVSWSDQEALPPYDGTEEQRVTEVFNGVPWTRVGDA
jgi:hypothetical protein